MARKKSDSPQHDDFQETLKILSRGWLPKWVTSVFRINIIRRFMGLLKDKFGRVIKSYFL